MTTTGYYILKYIKCSLHRTLEEAEAWADEVDKSGGQPLEINEEDGRQIIRYDLDDSAGLRKTKLK